MINVNVSELSWTIVWMLRTFAHLRIPSHSEDLYSTILVPSLNKTLK